jgi:hypothetical protein
MRDQLIMGWWGARKHDPAGGLFTGLAGRRPLPDGGIFWPMILVPHTVTGDVTSTVRRTRIMKGGGRLRRRVQSKRRRGGAVADMGAEQAGAAPTESY